MRGVRLIITAVEKLVCVCGYWYPACNAHEPYCHLWPVQLYSVFTYYLINNTICEKRLLNKY